LNEDKYVELMNTVLKGLPPPQVICQNCDVVGHTYKKCPEIHKKTWFKNQSLVRSFVMFLRQATILQIKSNEELYQNYLKDGENIENRCNLISTMGEEAEHLEINVLLTFLDIGSTLYQIDRVEAHATNTNAIQIYTLPDEKYIPKIFLLYRPGHYDILYKTNL